MINKYNRKHIGEKFISNEGYEVDVIDGGSKGHYCTVMIDGKYRDEVRYKHVKSGSIKNKLHPSIFGTGFVGIGIFSRVKHKKAYMVWNSMITRCYGIDYQKRHPTYKGVITHYDWHNFQNFARWFYENYIDGYDLDKDLLSNGSKIYSPHTCCFIPHEINLFIANVKPVNSSDKTGVDWSKRAQKWRVQIRIGGSKKVLGYYSDIDEAANVYKRARKIAAYMYKRKYRDILSDKIIKAIK